MKKCYVLLSAGCLKNCSGMNHVKCALPALHPDSLKPTLPSQTPFARNFALISKFISESSWLLGLWLCVLVSDLYVLVEMENRIWFPKLTYSKKGHLHHFQK